MKKNVIYQPGTQSLHYRHSRQRRQKKTAASVESTKVENGLGLF